MINNQQSAQNAPRKKRKSHYARTPLRKSVLLNFAFIFVPGMLVWWLLGNDTGLDLVHWSFWIHFAIAMALLCFGLGFGIVCSATKFTEPDQLLYSTSLMAVLMAFYLSSFSGWALIIQVLMAIAILLIVAFLTNGAANVWADNIQRKQAIAKLKKLNQRLQNNDDDKIEKIDQDDQEWLQYWGIKVNSTSKNTDKKNANPQDENNDAIKSESKEKSELEQLKEIKIENENE